MASNVAVFWEDSFPAIDSPYYSLDYLKAALDGFDVSVIAADEFDKLRDYDLLVLPYGSAFPRDAWRAMYAYMESGGNILNLGGAPFHVPCVKERSEWKTDVRQTSYAKELGINQAFPVEASRIAAFDVADDVPVLSGVVDRMEPSRTHELMVRFADVDSDLTRYLGSCDAVIHPLLYALDKSGNAIAAPFVSIDRVRGSFAGGRWVFANTEAVLSQDIIRRLAFHSIQSASNLAVNASYGCYYPGENPQINARMERLGSSDGRYSGRVTVSSPEGRLTTSVLAPIDASKLSSHQWQRCVDVTADGDRLSPGLYAVEVEVVDESAVELAKRLGIPAKAKPGVSSQRNGFWIYDEALITSGTDLTLDADYFCRDGETYPVMGTTYMSSEKHRMFIYSPTPYAWDQDFRRMKEAGVNMIRTGIWSGARRVMMDASDFDECCLRAVDAFLLTARKYDIPVIFTFFTFVPESWDAANPYLDKRALEAQKTFIGTFVERYANVPGLIWDLINEPFYPVYGPTLPLRDTNEEREWKEWLADFDRSELMSRWRLTPRQSLALPEDDDMKEMFIYEGTHPLKALDYRLFAQKMFNRWTKELSDFIKHIAGDGALVTVGQDEGGTQDRPNPMFHAPYVDFTCNHSWWRNNDLLWDSIVAKVPGKPCLIEETGVMFIEEIDGTSRRSEEDSRNLLERKLALSIGGSCAGAIQWCWNTNTMLKSDNEAAIGIMRADGTPKPELEPLTAISKFLWRNRRLMEDRQTEEVAMVIPYSNMLSAKSTALDATDACVRAIHYYNMVPMYAVSEYAIDGLGDPRLIILPSPRVLRQDTWETLLERVRAGATLLISGPIDYDEHWRRIERLADFGIATVTRPVAREEWISVNGREIRLTFGGQKIHRIDKAVVCDGPPEVVTLPCGRGHIVFAPLPFELSDNLESASELYDFAINLSGIERTFTLGNEDPGLLVRPIVFSDAVLYVVVSETDRRTDVRILHGRQGVPVCMDLPGQRAGMVFVDRNTGRALDSYVPVERGDLVGQ